MSTAFEHTLRCLKDAGALLTEIHVHAIENPNRPSHGARLLAAEAYAVHRSLLNEKAHLYDPRVSTRISFLQLILRLLITLTCLNWRKDFVHCIDAGAVYPFDAILMPTTPIASLRLFQRP